MHCASLLEVARSCFLIHLRGTMIHRLIEDQTHISWFYAGCKVVDCDHVEATAEFNYQSVTYYQSVTNRQALDPTVASSTTNLEENLRKRGPGLDAFGMKDKSAVAKSHQWSLWLPLYDEFQVEQVLLPFDV